MADQIEWALLHRLEDDEPTAFIEVRAHRNILWHCRGAANTFGRSEVTTFQSDEAAMTAFGGLIAEAISRTYEVSVRESYLRGTFDFDALKSEVKNASRMSYRRICARHPSDSIQHFGLLTDEVPMTIGAVANSLEAIEAEGTDKDEAQWNVSAWSFSDGGGYFDLPYRRLLAQTRRDIPFELPSDRFTTGAMEAFVRALEELRMEGEFPDRDGSPFVLLVQVSDADQIDGMVERLNGPVVQQHYRAFVG